MLGFPGRPPETGHAAPTRDPAAQRLFTRPGVL